jgi:hypothetical protein
MNKEQINVGNYITKTESLGLLTFDFFRLGITPLVFWRHRCGLPKSWTEDADV